MAIAKTTSADIMLVASIAVSILMSAIVVSQVISGQTFNTFGARTVHNLNPALSGELGDRDTAEQAAPDGALVREESGAAAPPVEDGQLADYGAAPLSPAQEQPNLASTFYSPIYSSAQYILPITWGAVAGTLIWRGKVRSAWCKQGYDYETFRLVARMKGSPVRVKLLNSVAVAKNRLQLANELDVDWKTIDNHMEILAKTGLVEEKEIVGTTRYYVLTEHGRRVLLLLADSEGEPAALGALGGSVNSAVAQR